MDLFVQFVTEFVCGEAPMALFVQFVTWIEALSPSPLVSLRPLGIPVPPPFPTPSVPFPSRPAAQPVWNWVIASCQARFPRSSHWMQRYS